LGGNNHSSVASPTRGAPAKDRQAAPPFLNRDAHGEQVSQVRIVSDHDDAINGMGAQHRQHTRRRSARCEHGFFDRYGQARPMQQQRRLLRP
jgi:hypothetical protein